MKRYPHTLVFAALVALFSTITWRLYDDNRRITLLAEERAYAAAVAEYDHCLQRNFTSAAIVRLIELIASSPTLPVERVDQYRALLQDFAPEPCTKPTNKE